MDEQSEAGRPPAGAPSPEAVVVRRARPGDAETLARFNEAMARQTEGKTLDPGTLRRGVEAVLADEERGFYLLAEAPAEASEEIAGALMVTREWSDWRNGFFWWIQSVYVRPEHRRQGVYRTLYAHVRRRAEETPGVCGLRLYVEKDNAAARAAYEALGMKETSYRMYEAPV